MKIVINDVKAKDYFHKSFLINVYTLKQRQRIGMPKSNNQKTCVRTTKILHWTPDNWNARLKGEAGEYLKRSPPKKC